ncbi:MAG TPA: hypothetical protein DCQ31_18890, partial [Bacteroidales bacterium]|nr:hypothetical protein [Bacteroidales bacterium]
ISTDKVKIGKILKHLLDNAIKFTAKGQIVFEINFQGNEIEFIISDTGIGISDHMQQLIFEPFRQLETGLARNYGGNGLGLSLAKAYLELLHGSISLQSEINKGTIINFSVPVHNSFLTNKVTKLKHKYNAINTLLIVEDEYTNYQYLLALLESSQLKILYAANGQQAVDLCRDKALVDLVLMDIKMPIMDGHTAAKLIKAFRPDLPIIAQTAYEPESERESFIEVFDGY